MDEQFAEEFERDIKAHSLSRNVFLARTNVGFTQEKLAETLGWEVDQVEHLESCADDEMVLDDYLKAMNRLGWEKQKGKWDDKWDKVIESIEEVFGKAPTENDAESDISAC